MRAGVASGRLSAVELPGFGGTASLLRVSSAVGVDLKSSAISKGEKTHNSLFVRTRM